MTISLVDANEWQDCGCGNLLNHWENHSGKSPIFCAAFGCMKKFGLSGALVKQTNSGKSIFVVPLCQEHLQQSGDFSVSNSTTLIPIGSEMNCLSH